MPREAPRWWYAKPGLRAHLLAPLSLIWEAATRCRWMFTVAKRADCPVICVGNLVTGGAGKTPAAIAVARLLLSEGEHPVFLSRGYGGRLEGPHRVDRTSDKASDVGDEPLILARVAPTIIASDRVAGARLAAEHKASVIVMDDGFQNPHLHKDLSLLVVDRATGIGNGYIMPAGPLRASLLSQLEMAQGIIAVGEGNAADGVLAKAQALGLPVFDAHIAPRDDTAWLKDQPLIAYSGIGHPEKFFNLLEELGCEVRERVSFPDHHAFTSQDADRLIKLAREKRALLVTTEKDAARLKGVSHLSRLRDKSRALGIRLRFREQGRVKRALKKAMSGR